MSMTRTAAWHRGYGAGMADGRSYATGTRAGRRAIRRRAGKSVLSYAAWWDGYYDGFRDAAEQWAEAIAAGLVARSANPHKLSRVLDRSREEASAAAERTAPAP